VFFKELRRRNFSSKIDIKRLEIDKFTLYIDHSLGGGTNSFSAHVMSNITHDFLRLSYNISALSYVVDIHSKRGMESFFFNSFSSVTEFLKQLNFKEIIVNSIVSFEKPELLIEFLVGLKKAFKSNCRLNVMTHDFYSLCPSFNLIDMDGQFCNVPDFKTCNKCLSKNSHIGPSYHHSIDIESWRSLWFMLLSMSDKITFFSKSSKDIFLKAYPSLNNRKLAVIPHTVEKLIKAKKINIEKTETLHIGVFGHFMFNKGSHIIESVANEINMQELDIKITLFGTTDRYIDNSVIEIKGDYNKQDLPMLIKKSGVNVVLFPSICPETFSYVTHEIIGLGLPIASFNLGAQAETISKYKNGLILNSYNPKIIIEKLKTFHKKIYK
jgi:glycosyltransferase involved in cell wall biosynthesis